MLKNVIPFVHDIIEKTIGKQDVCIDATCGNGNDTLFLTKLVKFVYAFDVQNQAIENTEKLLIENNIENFKLIHDSHSNIDKYIHEEVKVIMFNLGYLPGGDKSFKTASNSTITAVKKSIDLICKGGIITLIHYIGHDGGLKEANGVEELVKLLPRNQFKVIKYDFINSESSPFVIVIEKL